MQEILAVEQRRNARPSIVALAPNEWHGTWMNRQQLLTRLAARGWEIVYSTGCFATWDRSSASWREAPLLNRADRTDGVLVDHPGKLLTRWPKIHAYDKLIVAAHARRLRRLGGWEREGTIRVAYLFHPNFYPYLRHLAPDYVVYHIYDLHRAMGDVDDSLLQWEDRLVKSCNLLTVISQDIARVLPSPASSKAVVLENGVDIDLFVREGWSEPEDLALVPRPRIGYTGTINPKLDWETIEFIARTRPEWQFVFVGKVRDDQAFPRPEAAGAWERCRSYSNVHFLGPKTRQQVPGYVRGLDVCTICYRVADADWVRYGYPLKLHEYLACGKPTVCSDMPAVRRFAPVVRIAHGPDDWVRAIEDSFVRVDEGSAAERQRIARHNSWDNRVDQLQKLLLAMMAGSDQDHHGSSRIAV